MKRRPRIHAVIGLGALAPLLAVAVLATPASATGTTVVDVSSATSSGPVPNFTITTDGWIHYTSLASSVGAPIETTLVSGQRDASGACVSSGGSSAGTAASSIVQFTQEIAFDPKTCATQIATAQLTATQAAQLEATTPTTGAATPLTGSGTPNATQPPTSSTVTPAALTQNSRWLKTGWIDPINITIASQQVGLRWNSDSWTYGQYVRESFKGCLGSVCLDETNLISEGRSLVGVSNGWRLNARAHFQNVDFGLWVLGTLGASGWAACGFPSSADADFYFSDTVTGYNSGSASWNWSDARSGACTNLVSHGAWTGTTF